MEDYTRNDGSAMRRDAQRRAQQMRQRMPGISRNMNMPKKTENVCSDTDDKEKEDDRLYEEKTEQVRTESGSRIAVGVNRSGFGAATGLDRLLGQLDSDRMLILAILAMLYKDGGSKKLMMALAYLLT